MITKEREEYLNRRSLILARLFRDTYEGAGKDSKITVALLEAYCDARRELPKSVTNTPTGHSTRLGAHEAYLITKG